MATTSVFEAHYAAALSRSDTDDARRWLERGVDAGDAFSAAQLGVWLLLGHAIERDNATGARLVTEAALAGIPEARRLLATLYAQGRGVGEHFACAVEWLIIGAKAGDADALRQLAFLLPAELQAQPRALLNEAARGGDLTARRWLARNPASAGTVQPTIDWARIAHDARRPGSSIHSPVVACAAPRVELTRGMLSAELCDYLMCAAAPRLARASVNDTHSGMMRIDPSRSNSFANFWLLEGDVVTDCIDRMLADLVQLDVSAGEPLSVLHYRPGEQYMPHFDFFDPTSPVHAQEIARSGQRIATCLVYLNASYDGGETAFLAAGIKVRGEPGTAIHWRNTDGQGKPDRSTLHAGLPPTTGEKWLLSKWFRNRAQSDRAATVQE